jgi:catechol 2,3-dioxygenase-like lactoylglutathione lyase family enzyme
MKPRISYVTLGVDDLERAVRFYRDGLGLPTKGTVGADDPEGGVAFFELSGGVVLALWPRASIAKDTGLPMGAANATEFTLAHNVASTEEVDAAMAEALRAGARIVKPAHETFWGGYSGYFRDPDGHVWEVAWNPDYKIPE